MFSVAAVDKFDSVYIRGADGGTAKHPMTVTSNSRVDQVDTNNRQIIPPQLKPESFNALNNPKGYWYVICFTLQSRIDIYGG